MGTTLSETKQRSRRERVCIWCCGRVEVGEQYIRHAYRGDDSFSSDDYHPECYADLLDTAVEVGGWYEFSPGEGRRPFVHGGEHI